MAAETTATTDQQAADFSFVHDAFEDELRRLIGFGCLDRLGNETDGSRPLVVRPNRLGQAIFESPLAPAEGALLYSELRRVSAPPFAGHLCLAATWPPSAAGGVGLPLHVVYLATPLPHSVDGGVWPRDTCKIWTDLRRYFVSSGDGGGAADGETRARATMAERIGLSHDFLRRRADQAENGGCGTRKARNRDEVLGAASTLMMQTTSDDEAGERHKLELIREIRALRLWLALVLCEIAAGGHTAQVIKSVAKRRDVQDAGCLEVRVPERPPFLNLPLF